jgi:hypothetical protein
VGCGGGVAGGCRDIVHELARITTQTMTTAWQNNFPDGFIFLLEKEVVG